MEDMTGGEEIMIKKIIYFLYEAFFKIFFTWS